MPDLYPTKTRLALLADVEQHQVHRHQDGTSTTNAGFSTVTARITELERAGWVRLPAEDEAGEVLRLWELTTTGRDTLNSYRTPGATQ